MPTATPKEAAAAIREEWLAKPPAPAPSDHYKHEWLADVCNELHVVASYLNVQYIEQLLQKAGIEWPKAAEYPKAVNETDEQGRLVSKLDKAGNPVMFASAEDEAKSKSPNVR